MSDGPHRSLPMRAPWKALAERADNSNYATEQVAEAVCAALAGDWRAEVSASLLGAVALVLGDGEEGGLFTGNADELARIRVGCDSPLAAAFVDAAADALADGFQGLEAVRQAVEAALQDRALREFRSVEEHYLRKSPQARAANVRGRLESALGIAAVGDLAHTIAQGASTTRRFTPAKRDGLDEGVPL